MNGFQVGTLVLATLLCLFAWLDYKEKKRFNDVVLAPKKPCNCTDHDHPAAPPIVNNAPISTGGYEML